MTGARQAIRSRRRPAAACGFSLIEILAATAVLAVLIVLLAFILAQSTALTGAAIKRGDSAQTIEAVFGRIAPDLSRAVTDGGGAILVGKDTARTGRDDTLCLVLPGRGPEGSAPGRLLTAGYGLRLEDGVPSLHRDISIVPWNGGAATLLENAVAAASRSLGRDAATERQDFGPGILRLKLDLQSADGRIESQPANLALATFASNPALNAGWTAVDPGAATALVVSVASVAPGTATAFIAEVGPLAAALPDPAPGERAVDRWQAALKNGELDRFPLPLRQNLHFEERILPLP